MSTTREKLNARTSCTTICTKRWTVRLATRVRTHRRRRNPGNAAGHPRLAPRSAATSDGRLRHPGYAAAAILRCSAGCQPSAGTGAAGDSPGDPSVLAGAATMARRANVRADGRDTRLPRAWPVRSAGLWPVRRPGRVRRHPGTGAPGGAPRDPRLDAHPGRPSRHVAELTLRADLR